MNEQLPQVITRRELRRMVPYRLQHILRLEKKGKFPQRIKLVEAVLDGCCLRLWLGTSRRAARVATRLPAY